MSGDLRFDVVGYTGAPERGHVGDEVNTDADEPDHPFAGSMPLALISAPIDRYFATHRNVHHTLTLTLRLMTIDAPHGRLGGSGSHVV